METDAQWVDLRQVRIGRFVYPAGIVAEMGKCNSECFQIAGVPGQFPTRDQNAHRQSPDVT